MDRVSNLGTLTIVSGRGLYVAGMASSIGTAAFIFGGLALFAHR
jgi:hypothetical protein